MNNKLVSLRIREMKDEGFPLRGDGGLEKPASDASVLTLAFRLLVARPPNPC